MQSFYYYFVTITPFNVFLLKSLIKLTVIPNVANLVALSKLGVESEPERSAKKPTESPLKRRPLEKAKTTLLAHTESNSGQTKTSTEGRQP